MIVQVSGNAEPGKATPVTPRPLFKSRYAIVTPGCAGLNISRRIKDEAERDRLLEIAHGVMEGARHGLILRSAAEGVDADTLAGDIAEMRDLAAAVMGDTAARARAADGRARRPPPRLARLVGPRPRPGDRGAGLLRRSRRAGGGGRGAVPSGPLPGGALPSSNPRARWWPSM
jgi:hypothetical protein